ncbi:hypothetical protein HYPSUDRAFT_36353 [Hypholoma sublateritium FD-334 SS-4]|uniref:BTB domain-containing protein n=1 Tax=Hypholoma sublateritium (strain FD-334 SS-4) TaxID=945553 RepID=A0A0D2MRL9_HYPSF|nr:hypothetical protein HYPSUDRAFT_36353 [Hypholoma sublateritium FD-334 SS-4]
MSYSSRLRSAKRKRVSIIAGLDSESDLESWCQDTVERSTQFWFDDGNVVLQAESVQFRVHRSILSRHSPIMQDCLECPKPEDAPTIEGCPLVHLADLAKDIDNMCSLLYGMYQIDAKKITSSYLETMLFMGRKYEIASFTTSAENILEQLFPPILKRWDGRQKDVKRLIVQNNGFLFDVLNITCEYPMPSIMQPLLVSIFTIHSLDQLTSGIPRGEQPRAILKPSAEQYCVLSRLIFMQLSLRIFAGTFRKSDDIYVLPLKNCHSKTKCLDCFRRMMTDIVMKHTTLNTAAFPQTMASSYGESNFCLSCAGRLQDLVEQSRRAVWSKLPSVLKAFENADFA